MDREVGKLVGIIFLISVLVIVAGFIIYLSISHPERRLDVGANIESIDIKDNLAEIVLSGGANDKEIKRVKFIFTDSNGVKHYYSTIEGIENLSEPYKKSITNLFKKPEFEGTYHYTIDSNELGFENFNSIYKIEVVFDYEKEGLDVDKDVPLDEKVINEDSKPSGGGGGGSSFVPESDLIPTPRAYWRYSGSDVDLLNDMNYGTSLQLVLENSGLMSGTPAEFIIYEKDWFEDDYMAKLDTLVGSDGYVSVDWVIDEAHVQAARGFLEGRLELYFIVNGVESEVLRIGFTDTGAEPNCSDNIQNQDETDVDCGGLICNACIPQAGLVSHYTFDNNANDETGTNHGQLNNGASIIVDSERGNVLSLDGSDNVVTVADSSSLDITDEITLSAWINLDSFKSYEKVFMKPTLGIIDPWEYYAMHIESDGTVSFMISNGDTYSEGGWHEVTSSSPIVLNKWYHVTGTYDGQYMRLYIDGIEAGTPNQISLTMATNDEDLLIGGSFDGMIDDAMIYNTSLTEAEILDLYNSGEAVPSQHECYVSSDCPVITCKQVTCQLDTINTCQYTDLPDCGSGLEAREFFHDQNFLIPENVVLNDYVGEKIISPNHEPTGAVTFEVTGGTGASRFSINSNTGIITVSDTSGIDDGSSSYTLQLRATDTEYEDTALVTIDVLDVDSGNVIFIDPSYSGTETGSRSQPYNSWYGLTWISGNTYLQKRGTTYTRSEETLYIDSGVTMGAYGQGSRPIMSFARGSSTGDAYGNIYAFHTSWNQNILIRDLDLIATDSTAVLFTSSTNLVVDNCLLHGDNNYNVFRSHGGVVDSKLLNSELFNPDDDGIWMADTNGFEIAYTTIYDVNMAWFVDGMNTGGDNIHIGGYFPDANINLNIHHNRLDHSSTGWKQIIIIRGGGEPQQNLRIEYNLLLGREGTFIGRTECENGTSNGIVPIGIDGGVIRYNVIRNTMRGVIATSTDEPCNLLIAYNTMENNCFSAVQFGPDDDIELYNNVMTYFSLNGYESSGAAIIAGGSHIKMRNNIIYNDFGTSFYTDGGSADNIDEDYNIFYPASSIALGANSDIVDPLFVDAPNYDPHLQGNSPAINAGIDVGLTQDLDQNPIVGTSDIGAYEYQGTVTSDNFDIVFSQNFNNNPTGAYLRTTWSEDWGLPVTAWNNPCNADCADEAEWARARLTIHEESDGNMFMRHELAAKLYLEGDSGVSWFMPVGNHEELYLSYRIRFVGDDWNGPWYSGKIPGFCGGGSRPYEYCPGGGNPPLNYDGFTTRCMFSMDSDKHEVAFYLYYAGMIIDDGWGPYGDWHTIVSNVYPLDEWHTVTQRVVMNTPGTPNGIIEGFYDGVMTQQLTGMDYRNASDQYIKTLLFANFLGGSGENPSDYGDMPTLDFDDFVIYTYKDNVPGIPRGLEPSPAGRVIEIPQFGV